MTKLIAVLTMAAGAVAFTPAQPLAAQECTEGYLTCLNDTHHLDGWAQKMADVECFAKYVGCVGKSLQTE